MDNKTCTKEYKLPPVFVVRKNSVNRHTNGICNKSKYIFTPTYHKYPQNSGKNTLNNFYVFW